MIIATAVEYLAHYYPKQSQSFERETYMEAVEITELTYKYITGNGIDKEELNRVMKDGENYVPIVNAHWKTIRNDLQVYSYCKLV